MSKAKIVRDSEGPFHGIEIRCPGCLYSNGALMDHILPLNALPAGEKEMSSHIGRKDRWGFNGDFEKPTFTPSLNTWWGGFRSGDHDVPLHRCHPVLREGRIQFLGDCTHALKEQTVDLPEIAEWSRTSSPIAA
jgi:hypothetical protein